VLFCCLSLAGAYPDCSKRFAVAHQDDPPRNSRFSWPFEAHVFSRLSLTFYLNMACWKIHHFIYFVRWFFPAVKLHLVQGFPRHFWLPQSMCRYGPLYHFTILWYFMNIPEKNISHELSIRYFIAFPHHYRVNHVISQFSNHLPIIFLPSFPLFPFVSHNCPIVFPSCSNFPIVDIGYTL
jgi:hypothetical protein